MRHCYGSAIGDLVAAQIETDRAAVAAGTMKREEMLSYCPSCESVVFWKIVRRTNRPSEYRLVCLSSILHPQGDPPEIHVKDPILEPGLESKIEPSPPL